MTSAKSSFGSILVLLYCSVLCVFGADSQNSPAALPAKKPSLAAEHFDVQGHAAFLISPAQAAEGKPWIWYAPTLPGLPGKTEKWMFDQFTNAGIAIAGIDVGESYGSPKGCALFTALYEELVNKRGFSPRPCLMARSRGGLMLYNWAADHPQSVAGVGGIYPVCDMRSYPGLKNACSAYGMSEKQLAQQLAAHNPVNRVQPLAEAHVPIFHIHGDDDHLVPLDKNSAAFAEQYRIFGGQMKLEVMKGHGHDSWPGWFHCQELVDFIITCASGKTPEMTDANARN